MKNIRILKKEIPFDKFLFEAGAAWNIIIGLAIYFWHAQIWNFLGMPPFAFTLPIKLFAGAVLIFGAGYAWVGLDSAKNHPIIIMGTAGKIMVFLLVCQSWLNNETPFFLCLLGLGDLVFAVFFIWFLVDFHYLSKNKSK